MPKNSTHTIYNCLKQSFWTNHKCGKCQKQFTNSDYQTHNYYLTFQEILKVRENKEFLQPRASAYFDGVLVRLFHQNCQTVKSYPGECQIDTVKDIICDKI